VVDRTHFVAYPRGVGEATCQRLVTDVVAAVTRLTGCHLPQRRCRMEVLPRIEQLRRRARSGTALFVLDPERLRITRSLFNFKAGGSAADRAACGHYAALDGSSGDAVRKGA